MTGSGQGGVRLTAVDAGAAAAGLSPGMTLADARAVCPALVTAPADPAADARGLARLADWCGRYSPWVAADGGDGIRLDITGSAHLMGGEQALLADLARHFERWGLGARLAAGDTLGAAWAWARHGPGGVLPGGEVMARLAPLPVAALRLGPEVVAGLARLGLCRVGELYRLPRAPLAARFGAAVSRRLDQALGRVAEPVAPPRPAPAWRTRLAWPEPIGTLDGVRGALDRLLERLAELLAAERRGARRLELALYRVDGRVTRLAVGTARPSRAPGHLGALFAEHLDGLDLGFGIEAMALAARSVEPLAPAQAALDAAPEAAADAVAELIDRLRNRLGPGHVVRLEPRASHIPERAVTVVPALGPAGPGDWPAAPPRPLRLLPAPEPIEVTAPAGADRSSARDQAPGGFRWRRVAHRVARAEGPERIEPEWWRAGGPAAAGGGRDYFRLEDSAGRRFWVYRAGPRWYLHGLFP